MRSFVCAISLFLLFSATAFGQDSTRTKNRFSLGLAYTSGPRAYGSKGFVGPQINYTFGKGRWEASAFVGGYYNYNEDGSQTRVIGTGLRPGQDIPAYIVYNSIDGLQIAGSILKQYPVSSKIRLGIGARLGYTVIRSLSNFNTIPLDVTDTILPYNGLFFYTENRFLGHAIYGFTNLILSTDYKLTNNLRLGVEMGAGPTASDIKRTKWTIKEYIFKKDYSPFNQNGSYRFSKSPNDIEAIFSGQSGNYPSQEKRFSIIGISFVTFKLCYILTH